MKKLATDKNLTIINFVIVSYFLLIWGINTLQIDAILIGVFRELLTIPFLIAQIAFSIIGIIFIIKNPKKTITTISLVLLIACAVITISSFFE